ncbi:MAG TPA: hypothetical protein VMV18_03490 [bacterium]|nr:hypothetical protein [bacterium]
MKRWVVTVSLTLGLLATGSSALAKGSSHKNLRPVQSNSKVHTKPRIGAKSPKALGTKRRTGNNTGNVETAEPDRNLDESRPVDGDGK